ncbi:hypothetical protein ACFFGK_08305 [Pseudarthrobacter scleromae]
MTIFGAAAPGIVDSTGGTKRWRTDIQVVVGPTMGLSIEYDGEHWHAKRREVDTRKTLDLLDAGYFVARIRENHLPFLEIQHERLLQVRSFLYKTAPLDTIRGIKDWLSAF